MITFIRELVTLDEEVITKVTRRMKLGLQMDRHRNVDAEVARFPSTGDAEITAWGER